MGEFSKGDLRKESSFIGYGKSLSTKEMAWLEELSLYVS